MSSTPPGPADFPPNDRFDPIELLGLGSSSEVWAVFDRHRGRRVALKLLHANTGGNPDAEFEVLRHLHHPMLAAAHDTGTLAGRTWFTQDEVSGVTPEVWCGSDPARVASLGAQVGWVLAFVHGRGVLHLDVKPDNLRVVDGQVRLLDFGLARRAGAFVRGGTPAFVAPEVLSGAPVDARADLYGLGATLYRLLTGRPPFVAASVVEHLEQVLRRTPVPVSRLRPDLSPDWDTLLEDLLATRPEQRLDDAAEVTRRLAPLANDLPPLTPGHPGCVGRDALLATLRTPGWHVLSGPPGIGRRFLLRERLREAQQQGARVGDATGRGLDALEAAIRAAGGTPILPEPTGPPQQVREQRADALARAVTADMVLGLVEPGPLPMPPVAGTVIVTAAIPDDGEPTVSPLSDDGIRAFLEDAQPGREVDEALVAAARHATDGFPGRLAVWVRDPDRSSSDANEPLTHLPEAARVAACVLAVLERPYPLSVLHEHLERPAALGDAADIDLAKGLTELAQRGLARYEVARPSEGWRLSPPGRRDVLRAAPPLEPEALRRIARCLLELERTPTLLRLADEVAGLIAALRARAAQSLELDTRREALAEIWSLTGQLDDALALERTLDELGDGPARAELLASLPESAEVLLRRAKLALEDGDPDGGLAQLDRALAAATGNGTRARALRLRGQHHQRRADHAAASRDFAHARALVPDDDDALRAHCIYDLGLSAIYLGRYAEAMPHFREALPLKLALGDVNGARITRQNLGICHEATGQPHLARRAYEAALDDATRCGSLRGQLWNHMALAGLLRRLGQPEDAARHLRAAEELSERVGGGQLAQGVATERALLNGQPEELAAQETALREAGNSYDADRLALARITPRLLPDPNGQPLHPAPEWLPGEHHFPEHHAALRVLAGLTDNPPESESAIGSLARAAALRRAGQASDAEKVLLGALDATWDTTERRWLRTALVQQQPATDGAVPEALLALGAQLGAPLPEVLVAGLDAATQLAGATRAVVRIQRPSERTVCFPDAESETPPAPLGEALVEVMADVIRSGEPWLQADRRDTGDVASPARSVLCVPLRSGSDSAVGAMLLTRADRAAFGAEAVAAAQLVADLLTSRIERAVATVASEALADELRETTAALTRKSDDTQRELQSTRLLLEITRSELDTRHAYPGLIGRSRALRQTVTLLDKVIPTTLSVLLEGESGTGKELLAQAVHEGGPNRTGRFVAVDCGAVVPTLFESAFFGHRRGAFTGATNDRDGYLRLADGGTLFLDEIGELPLDGQARLLRALETGSFWPVGAEREARASFRVVAATNRDLADMVEAGTFRRDLFYRLAHVRVPVPPLRERPEDIPLLIDRFRGELEVDSGALRALVNHHWPGNVRELKHTIERAAALSDNGLITAADLGPEIGHRRESAGRLPKFTSDLKTYIDDIERRIIAEVLARESGNITTSAEILGLSRHGLRKKLVRLGLRD